MLCCYRNIRMRCIKIPGTIMTSIKIIPYDIDQFYELTILVLEDNKISAIPTELFSIINMKYISLVGNNIEYIPKKN